MRPFSRIVLALPSTVWPSSSESYESLRALDKDLRREGIFLVPGPPLPWQLHPRWNLWNEWIYHLRRGHFFSEPFLEYYWHRAQFWPRRWLYHPAIAGPIVSLLGEELISLLGEGRISGIAFLATRLSYDDPEASVVQWFIRRLSETVPSVHITVALQEAAQRPSIPDVSAFFYPAERLTLLEAFSSFRPAGAEPLAEHSLGLEQTSAEIPVPDATPAPGGVADQPSTQPIDEVHLGAAVPPAVALGGEFVARFLAYTAANRREILRVIEDEAPLTRPRLELETCRWHRGATVTVRLTATRFDIANPVQSFKWNGAWRVLRFDVKVPHDLAPRTVALKFDIAVEGLPVALLRPEIQVASADTEHPRVGSAPVVECQAPATAFASYAKEDSREVLGRLRSLQIFTGIDVFLDCLSIRPGEAWKPRLRNEIHEREIFWLFWSRRAKASQWVDWEWRTALADKSLASIQPHPLEPADLAPPPGELSPLQFGAMYEWYISELRESPIRRFYRRALRKAFSILGRR